MKTRLIIHYTLNGRQYFANFIPGRDVLHTDGTVELILAPLQTLLVPVPDSWEVFGSRS